MTTIFLNGGAPNYTGYIFNQGALLLNTIRGALESAGWVTTTDNITSASWFISNGNYGSDNCWVKFSVIPGQINNQFSLLVQGDLLGNNLTLSPATTTLEFIQGGDNQLWLSCDESGGCLSIIPFSGDARGIHFGFTKNRVSGTDTKCIYVGYLNTHVKYTYVAETYYTSAKWYHLIDSFRNMNDFLLGTNTTSTSHSFIFAWGITDRFTCNVGGFHGSSFGYTDNRQNYLLAPHRGQLSPITNKPILGDYYYVELAATAGTAPAGTGINTDTALAPQVFYYRGQIRFATIGLASLPAGAQVITDNQERYLSVGSPKQSRNTDEFGWQGFRIL
jgi:hypothetical protein